MRGKDNRITAMIQVHSEEKKKLEQSLRDLAKQLREEKKTRNNVSISFHISSDYDSNKGSHIVLFILVEGN